MTCTSPGSPVSLQSGDPPDSPRSPSSPRNEPCPQREYSYEDYRVGPQLLRRDLRFGCVGLPKLVVRLFAVSNTFKGFLETLVPLTTRKGQVDRMVCILVLSRFRR